MTLKEFIDNYVCKNTLVRLWKPVKGGHEMLVENDESVCMEWEISQSRNNKWQIKYKNTKVIGVTDILVEDFYREAVNIVLDL